MLMLALQAVAAIGESIEQALDGRMVDRLEESDMVERRRDPADRRAWRLYLTQKSQKLVSQLQRSVDLLVEGMLDGLTSDERNEFARLLKTVGANLSHRRETARIAHG